MIKKKNQNLYCYFIPLLLGAITSFSLPPYNFLLINFITFPLLLFLLIEIKKKNFYWQSFKIGWLFGIGYFFSNIYWIVYSLTFEDIFKPFIPIALILIPSFLGLFYGFITLLTSRFRLEKKGNVNSIIMSATPIPRSLALTVFSDRDLTTIKEKPKNRLSIETLAISVKKICDFLDIKFANRSLEELVAKVKWSQPELQIFGRTMPSPRLSAWYGDKSSSYRYSGLINKPLPWLPNLLSLKNDLSFLSGFGVKCSLFFIC